MVSSNPQLQSFFFNYTATTEIYTLSLHDALPILPRRAVRALALVTLRERAAGAAQLIAVRGAAVPHRAVDRKSTRLNSSHVEISYAVFCLKKKIDPFNSQHWLSLSHTALWASQYL